MPVIRAEASTQDLLDAVTQLPAEELAEFVQRVAMLHAEGVVTHLPRREAALLIEFGRGISAEERDRYRVLIAKRDDETLTPDEHTELMRLSDAIEMLDVERVSAVFALARLRGVPPDELLRSLGIQSAADGP